MLPSFISAVPLSPRYPVSGRALSAHPPLHHRHPLPPSRAPPSAPSSPRRPRRRHPVASAAANRVLWASDLTKTHDGRTYQFSSISLNLPRGAKVAILGPNGSGKSTLLAILAGQQSPDAGSVSLRKGATLALVSQELPSSVRPDETALAAVLRLAGQHTSSPVVRAALRYVRATAAVASAAARGEEGGEEGEELAAAAAEMEERVGAWEVESYVEAAMDRLRLPREVRVAELSGGQKRRVGIAAALVARPDVLLLDEVTNHLSIEGIQFLEETLQDAGLTVLCISHDRYFVDRVCRTGIWELDGGGLRAYGPGYESFLEEKMGSLETERRDVGTLEKAVKKELEWIRKQPKARATKSKARVEAFDEMKEELKRRKEGVKAAGVKGLSGGVARLGGEVVELKDVTLRRGDQVVLRDFNYRFERGERVGLCGGNGVGKSSFIRALMGEVPIDGGSIDVGDTVVFGHFDQDGIDLAAPLSEVKAGGNEVRVVDYVTDLVSLYGSGSSSAGSGRAGRGGGRGGGGKDAGEDAEARLDAQIESLSYSVALSAPSAKAAAMASNPLMKMTPVAMLDHFGFKRAHQHAFVSTLSGGERRRLQLMALLLKNPNFLLLDEVSNDLDVNTLTMLEELLLDYSGVLVLCSHDRFMLDRLVDHLLILEGDGRVSHVEGKFTDYLEAKRQAEAEAKRNRKAASAERDAEAAWETEAAEMKKKKKKKLSYKEQKEYGRIEGEIEACQRQCEELAKKLEVEATRVPYGDLAEWTAELARLEGDIEAKTERWMELAEIAGE